MIIPDHKKLATVIVGKLGKEGETEMKPEDGGEDPLHVLAEDLLHAIDTKSPSAIVDAFRAMTLACQGEPEGYDGDDEA